LTQQGDFFKRDQERFTADTMLAGSPVDQIEPLRDAGQFLVAFGLANGVLHRDGMQLLAGTLPSQSPDLDTHVRELWTALPELNAWDAMTGWRGLDSGPHPYASAGLVSCGLLAGLPADQWVRPESIAESRAAPLLLAER
jgi:hypothetical protein